MKLSKRKPTSQKTLVKNQDPFFFNTNEPTSSPHLNTISIKGNKRIIFVTYPWKSTTNKMQIVAGCQGKQFPAKKQKLWSGTRRKPITKERWIQPQKLVALPWVESNTCTPASDGTTQISTKTTKILSREAHSLKGDFFYEDICSQHKRWLQVFGWKELESEGKLFSGHGLHNKNSLIHESLMI